MPAFLTAPIGLWTHFAPPWLCSSPSLASTCWLLPLIGQLFLLSFSPAQLHAPPPSPWDPALFAPGCKKLLARAHLPGPLSSQVKCISFYLSLPGMVLPLALAQAVSLRCLLSIDRPLEGPSNPVSSRMAFLTVLVHPDPGFCDLRGSWVDWAVVPAFTFYFFGAFLSSPILHSFSPFSYHCYHTHMVDFLCPPYHALVFASKAPGERICPFLRGFQTSSEWNGALTVTLQASGG